ncbi:hypothetical protein RND71_023752 [Anisodus tanguticus]|uniref:Uncharacterized protein n=1 Tax=Anisodus tanguticus TaxID=243964 RepID=A0AAE1RW34_9SOLA|nr:hypothetical protein RND71_023752 [Anisodus tanguticus]
MNFLMLRSNQTAASDHSPAREVQSEPNHASKPSTTLEGLIAEEPFTESEKRDSEGDEYGNVDDDLADANEKTNSQFVANHIDVKEDEGWITIPKDKLPDNWSEAPDISSICSLDRFFVIPGEQVHILACLSAYKQDTEIITPFKVAAVMHKNGIGQSNQKQNGNTGSNSGSVFPGGAVGDISVSENGNANIDPEKEVSAGENLLRLEDYKRQTESLVQRFNSSHFFARIAESDEPLWSKRKAMEEVSDMIGADGSETVKTLKKNLSLSASTDKGNFDARTSGGVARNAVKCCALPNGDIVVLLQVNVGIEFVRDPVLEILQFEKYEERSLSSLHEEDLTYAKQDPCGELLKWLLPIDNTIPPSARPLSPPQLSSSASIRSTSSTKPTLSGSSGSQLFSFGNFRSYSMSSLPPNSAPPPSVTTSTTGPSFNPEDWERFSFQRSVKSEKTGSEGLLSFRGVSLEPERFSVRCGLEGIFIPGRRWRRKIEIIQPVEITSFAADCNTDDLLCVQIKNVCPAHAPDIVVYIDAVTIIFEEASKSGPPLSLPITCIEAGEDYGLPNLALRRGEEHSFILKPVNPILKSSNGHSGKTFRSSRVHSRSASSTWNHFSNIEDRNIGSPTDKYAVLVSCRCNYTESKLFFKQPTSWRPRISRDLMISVASEMTKQTLGSFEGGAQLPVQVLTLQASNLTSQDLTMTVLAPASFTSPPSVVSLSTSPTSPMSPFIGSSDFTERVSIDKKISAAQSNNLVSVNQVPEGKNLSQSVSFSERATPIHDVLPSGDLGCTHLWLQSRVPLGCVPAQSTATIKLEVLPLMDGIITLDSLQIDVKEKGVTYVPEYSLKINATSSISTGII